MDVQQLPLLRNVLAVRARIRCGFFPRRARRKAAISARGFSVLQRRGGFLLLRQIVLCLSGFSLFSRPDTRVRRIFLVGRTKVAGCYVTYQVVLSLERALTAIADIILGKCVRHS